MYELLKFCIEETNSSYYTNDDNDDNENNNNEKYEEEDEEEDEEDEEIEIEDIESISTECSDLNNQIIIDTDSKLSSLTVNNISDDISEASYYDLELSDSESIINSGKIDIFDNLKNYQIVNNIPILFDPCKSLLKKFEKNIQVKHIMEHLLNCSDCDITNNNNTHIKSTYNVLSTNDIKKDFDFCDYEDALQNYFELKPYTSEKGEYIKITRIDDYDDYENSFIIEYTSRIKKKYIKTNSKN